MKYSSIIYIYVCGLLCCILWSCNNSSGKAIEDVEPIRIERFDTIIAGFDSMDRGAKDSLVSTYGSVFKLLVPQVLDSTHDPDSLISEYSHSNAVTVFESDIISRLGQTELLEEQLGQVKTVFNDLFADADWPKRIIGIVLPYNQSIVFVDTCALVGLNHYLGLDYEGYRYFEPYQRRLKTKEQLPVRLAESILLRSYPYKRSDESTALSRMLYDGAVLSGVRRSLPDTPDSVLMGWSREQNEWVNTNLAKVWQSLIERKQLFSTDPVVADRLTRMAPTTSIVSSDCPGRIGSYLGMLIVDRFLEKNEQAEPSQMLDSAVYNSSTTLVKSGFAPQLGI